MDYEELRAALAQRLEESTANLKEVGEAFNLRLDAQTYLALVQSEALLNLMALVGEMREKLVELEQRIGDLKP